MITRGINFGFSVILIMALVSCVGVVSAIMANDVMANPGTVNIVIDADNTTAGIQNEITVENGSQFTVDVWVLPQSGQEASVVDARVDFDTSYLSVDITSYNAYENIMPHANTLFNNARWRLMDNTNGYADYSDGTALGGTNPTTDFPMCYIVFNADNITSVSGTPVTFYTAIPRKTDVFLAGSSITGTLTGITVKILEVPIVDFTIDPTNGNINVGQSVTFTANTTSGGPVESWAWDFDNDGTIDSTDANPTWDYGNVAGTYTVKLTGTNALGSDSETKANVITVSPRAGGMTSGAMSTLSESEIGVTDISDVVTNEGVFTEGVIAESEDGKVNLVINEDAVGKTKDDEPLSEISIAAMGEPPATPTDSSAIGLTYDLGPDEATFDPPITLILTYDPDEIPKGVSEENLVIAMWDEDAGEWITLEGCSVDPVTHTIMAPVSHFTAFTILAFTSPAAFTVGALTVSPTEADIGETVTISLLVTNTGDLAGSYEVTLKIGNVAIATKDVTLAGGASQTVTFTTDRDIAGTYAVNVDGLSGTFAVKTSLTPVPTEPINWALIVWIIVGVLIVGGLLPILKWYHPARRH